MCSEVVQVLRQLIDLGAVELLDFFNEPCVIGGHEVEGIAFSAVPACSSDSVHVLFFLLRKVIVNDETDLLHIDASCKEICSDEYSRGAGSELLHDDVPLILFHVGMHLSDCKLLVVHVFSKLDDALFSVTIDQSLLNVEVLVQV